MIQVRLKNDAQIDTEICRNPFKNNAKSNKNETRAPYIQDTSDPRKPGHHERHKIVLGLGVAQGRFQSVKVKPNEPTWSQEDTKRTSKVFKMKPEALKMKRKWSQGYQKYAKGRSNKSNDVQKKNAPRMQTVLRGTRPGAHCFRFYLEKSKKWNQNLCITSSKINATTAEKEQETIMFI